MVKHRIIYDTKDVNSELVRHFKDFDNFADACTFLREIKSHSVTKPVIEEVPYAGSQQNNQRKTIYV
jgi:hypothetical protein